MILGCAGCKTTSTHHATTPTVTNLPSVSVSTYHQVRRGETLWRISQIYGVDVEAIAQANSLGRSSTIEVGQKLYIPRQITSTPAVPTSTSYIPYKPVRDSFLWPVRGTVISPYGSKFDKTSNKGIDILAEEGRDVRASRAGKVVYCDENMKGFGKTVILDHGDGFQTVYAYNSRILTSPGAIVRQNEAIAKTGNTGRAKQASLHFEIRKAGEPQNPYYYLPR